MKALIIAVAVMLFAGLAQADNSERIKELTLEGQKIIDQRNQAIEFQKRCEVRINEINGAISELKRLDKKEKETEKEKEPCEKPS